MRRARRWATPILVAVAISVLLGGCGGLLGSFVATRDGLSQAGFSHVSVGVAGQDDLHITATVDQAASDSEIRLIAAVVWRDFHERFGLLDITLHAADRTLDESISYPLVRQQFGPRPAADDRTSLRNGIVHAGTLVLAGLGVLILAAAALAVVLVRRRRRRRLAGPAGPGPGQWDQGAPAGQWDQGPPAGQWDQGAPAGQWDQGAPAGRWDQGAPAPGSWGEPVPEPADQHHPWQPPPGSGPAAWG